MASKVEICNRALQKLGAKRIVSLTDDSVNARACNVAFEPVKLKELRAHTWNFATKRFSIAADIPAPTFGPQNSFTLPADWVRLLAPDPERNIDSLDWTIEGKKIFTNDSAPLQGRYVADITDPNVMDSCFREALSSKLAVELAEELTQSNAKKADAKDDYNSAINEAKRTNAIEKPAPAVADDQWVTVRR
jgi:hypothetical protein